LCRGRPCWVVNTRSSGGRPSIRAASRLATVRGIAIWRAFFDFGASVSSRPPTSVVRSPRRCWPWKRRKRPPPAGQGRNHWGSGPSLGAAWSRLEVHCRLLRQALMHRPRHKNPLRRRLCRVFAHLRVGVGHHWAPGGHARVDGCQGVHRGRVREVAAISTKL
jgi:hypothetical protein